VITLMTPSSKLQEGSKAHRGQNRLAAKRSREKRKHDQVRNEGNAGEEKEQEGGGQFARIWGMLDQQNGITSGLKLVIAEQKGAIAERDEPISGHLPASGKFAMILESPMRERVAPSRSPCRSTILSCLPLRSLHRGANSMNAVIMWELEEGMAERKTPRYGSLIQMRARRLRFMPTILKKLDHHRRVCWASRRRHRQKPKQNCTSPPASQIGPCGLVLDKGPRGGPGGSGAAFEDPAAASGSWPACTRLLAFLLYVVCRTPAFNRPPFASPSPSGFGFEFEFFEALSAISYQSSNWR
jgi:hypothetical protein